METWIALYRGINVGGRNKIPMAALTKTLESAGCRSVRSYIQSGNIVFSSASKSKRRLIQEMGDATAAQFGFRPSILLLTADEFLAAVANNPFPEAIDEPRSLHYFFLESRPDSPDLDGIVQLATPTERFQLIDTVFYLHAPDGLGRSKFAASVERKIGVPATARNYNTIQKLSALLDWD